MGSTPSTCQNPSKRHDNKSCLHVFRGNVAESIKQDIDRVGQDVDFRDKRGVWLRDLEDVVAGYVQTGAHTHQMGCEYGGCEAVMVSGVFVLGLGLPSYH